MQGLLAISIANAEGITLIVICVFSAFFLVAFLIALCRDGSGIRKTRSSALGNRRRDSAVQVPPTQLVPGQLPQFTMPGDRNVILLENTRTPHRDFGRSSDESTAKVRWIVMVLAVSATVRLSAQATDSTTQPSPTQQDTNQQTTANQATAAPAPTPLTTPAITGPLQATPPTVFDAGLFGQLDLGGVLSGTGFWQSNHIAGDNPAHAALSNAQIFIQNTNGWWQFYVQAGAYNILSVGTPFLSTEKAVTDLYGPVPVAYLKLAPAKNTSIQIGALPTLMGAEYTFDFENMNVERGLLWNQENAINRGIQVNQTLGKFTAALSWNDGYYSNRYSWLSGSLTYVNGPHSVAFIGMGNLGQTRFQTPATPVQNNGVMYAVIYTYTKGSWIVQPYYQYSGVPTNPGVGVVHGASTNGGALLVSRMFKRGLSVAGRGEYIATTGSAAEGSVNLLYGPGSASWSVTVTPTYQYQRFFARGDLSFVRASSITPGAAFGPAGTNPNQVRGVMEAGFLF